MPTNPSLSEADDIRRQMAQIRAQLHSEMRGVVVGATAATDWHSHIRKHPWLSLGVAFGAGFLLVPRRSQPQNIVLSPAVANRAEFAVAPPPPAEASRIRPLRWLFGVISPIALRAAQTYALSHVERLLIDNPPGASSAPVPPPSSPFRTANSDGKANSRRS